MPKTRVLVYGDSLLLAGVQALLAQAPGIELVAFAPDVVVFDAAKTAVQELTGAFQHLPAVRLIGLDGTAQHARVMQAQTHVLAAAHDLVRLIQAR